MQQPGSLGCLLTLLCALLLGIEQEGAGPRAPEHHQLQSQPILPCPGELPQNTSSAHQSARTCIGHLHSSLRKDFKGTIQTYKQFSGYSCFQVPEVKCSTPFPQYFQLLRSVQGVVPKFSGDWCICLATPICLLKNKFVLCWSKWKFTGMSTALNSPEAEVLGWASKPICFGSSFQLIAQFSILCRKTVYQLKGSREVSKQLSQQCQSSHLMTSPRLTTVPKLLCPIALVRRSQLNFLLFWD